MSFIVEMAGIPGAGKTTVRDELMRHLEDVITPAPPAFPKVRLSRNLAIRWFASHLLYLATMGRHRQALLIATHVMLGSNRTLAQRLQVIRFLTVTFQRYRESRDAPLPRTVLVDEGIIQRCFMIFVEAAGTSSAFLDRYVRRCPAPDAVVLVQIDPGVALERVLRRRRGLPPRMADLSRDESLRVLREGADLLENAVTLFAQNAGTVVLRVNGNELQDAELEQLATDLTQMTHRRPVAQQPVHKSGQVSD